MEGFSFSQTAQTYLLNLARQSLEGAFDGREVDYGAIPQEVRRRLGTFVTLTKDGQLRGCIGNIDPQGEVQISVAKNARSSAFQDYRFPPLEEKELEDVEIEISILSLTSRMEYKSPQELLIKLLESKPGVVIENGDNRATYLPQVWEDITDAQEFISTLCLKAGLQYDFWDDPACPLEVYTYEVANFSE